MNLRELVRKMRRMQAMHRALISRAASEQELHWGQPPILEFIMRSEGCTQQEVAAFLRVSPPSIANSLKRMERAGWIRRETDRENLRKNRLYITEEGKQRSLLCRASCDEVDKTLFAGFTEEELAAFSGYLDRMTENLAGENLPEGWEHPCCSEKKGREA